MRQVEIKPLPFFRKRFFQLISQMRKYAVIVKSDYEDTFISLDLRLPPGGKEQVEKLLKDTNQAEKS